MSDGYLPIDRESDNVFYVMVDKEKKYLSNQIPIYKKDKNGGYIQLGSSSQNRTYEVDFQEGKYFVKNEDKNYLIGGNKTKRRQYRYRYSSKKRVASQRRGRGRGRQTRYSRRK
jgi:hypothetical protein